MHKIAIVVLADTETHGDLGRAVNALEVAKEFQEANDEVAIVFDGAGTKWVPAFEDASHKRHELWTQVKGSVAGACSFCSAAFGAKSGVQAAGVALLDDYEQHPSLRGYVARGFTILTF
ncbi:MAG: hypothetical protein U5K81_01905 [Trueperaceae bacterium]|nr:hypothetical protein [Trueperaceae bacterium]